jgi:hypothetical protein
VSRYGQLFEQASIIRKKLQSLLPGKLSGNYTPDDAKRFAREPNQQVVAQVDALADEWSRLERQMRETED